MTESQFLKQLESELRRLPSEERKDILYDYEEHIRTAMEEGVREDEAVAALGNPRTIAKELLATHLIDRAEEKRSVGNTFRAVLATVGLGFFNVVILLGPFLGLVGCLIGLFATSLALILGPIASLIGMFTGHMVYGAATPTQVTFFLVGVDGVGWLLLALTIVIGKFLGAITFKYLRLNLRIIQGGRV